MASIKSENKINEIDEAIKKKNQEISDYKILIEENKYLCIKSAQELALLYELKKQIECENNAFDFSDDLTHQQLNDFSLEELEYILYKIQGIDGLKFKEITNLDKNIDEYREDLIKRIIWASCWSCNKITKDCGCNTRSTTPSQSVRSVRSVQPFKNSK